jgi:hypothetical protein
MSKLEKVVDNRILASITVGEFEAMLAKIKAPKPEDRLLDIEDAMKVLGYRADQKQSFERNKEIAKCRRKTGHKTVKYSNLAIQRYIESLEESRKLTVVKSVTNA